VNLEVFICIYVYIYICIIYIYVCIYNIHIFKYWSHICYIYICGSNMKYLDVLLRAHYLNLTMLAEVLICFHPMSLNLEGKS
jgi:hypothetical protein